MFKSMLFQQVADKPKVVRVRSLYANAHDMTDI
jgi:hypothetical protein